MATTAVLPGLPSGLGATVIQANAILLPSATEYKPIDWNTAKRFVNENGGKAMFIDSPFGSTNPNLEWTFFLRGDMPGGGSNQATLVGVWNRTHTSNRTPAGTSTQWATKRKRYTVYTWTTVTVTLTDGKIYSDVLTSIVGATLMVDPETNLLLVPTNGYQAVHEALGLVLQPVAAGAPNWNPAYAGIVGMNPNV